MNLLNYASLEASKRLVEAGIVLETDFFWTKYRPNEEYALGDTTSPLLALSSIPAPSMVEVWRELPESIDEDYQLNIQKAGDGKYTSSSYCRPDHAIYECIQRGYYANTNPTDALVDLLIWVRKEAADG